MLPVSQMNETSVTVEIQHDGSVHQGPCTASGGTCKVSGTYSKTCTHLLRISADNFFEYVDLKLVDPTLSGLLA